MNIAAIFSPILFCVSHFDDNSSSHVARWDGSTCKHISINSIHLVDVFAGMQSSKPFVDARYMHFIPASK